MEVIANQDRESERSDCDEKDDDFIKMVKELEKRWKEAEELHLQLEERSKEREKQREERRLQFEKRWKEGSLGFFGTVKTPTEVMLEKKTHEAFVYEAEDKYKDFDEKDKHEPYFYISQLPMRINKKLEERNRFEEKPNAIKEIKRNDHVIAITFGPTYAANVVYIIHVYEADPDTGFVNDWLYQGGSLATVIKPTVDLVEHDGKTVGAFGREAEDKYKNDYDYGQYFYTARYKMMLVKVGKSGPRNNTIGGKHSKVWYEQSTDRFDFLAERKTGFQELPKTELKKSPIPLWQGYCQDQSLGKSKTLLSKPLHDERSETENFSNYSSKPAEHSTSAKEQDAKIPDNDRLLCKVCYMFELNIVFLPCSHMVACRKCAAKLKTCPVCRSGIKEALPAILHE